MIRPAGFSTGALAKDDFRRALDMLRRWRLPAGELSALRDSELLPLLESLGSLDLSKYTYVSVHAPSSFKTMTEREATGWLATLLPRRWPIVVHPDVVVDDGAWRQFGESLCIENMDKRKPTGRTVAELDNVFGDSPARPFVSTSATPGR